MTFMQIGPTRLMITKEDNLNPCHCGRRGTHYVRTPNCTRPMCDNCTAVYINNLRHDPPGSLHAIKILSLEEAQP